MKYYASGINNRTQADLFQCLQLGQDGAHNLIQGRRWAAVRDGEASFLETPSNQVHNQVMRIMDAELFDSLIRNNIIYAGKAPKFSFHNYEYSTILGTSFKTRPSFRLCFRLIANATIRRKWIKVYPPVSPRVSAEPAELPN